MNFDYNLNQATKWVMKEVKATEKKYLPDVDKWNAGTAILDDALELGGMTCKEIETEYAVDLQDFSIRKTFTKEFGWSIPCAEAISAIKQWSNGKPVYDVMAGSGYWSKIMRDHGINAIPSDVGTDIGGYTFTATHYPIGKKEARQASGEAHRGKPINLFISWPPYKCPITHKLLAQLPIGSVLFMVGESHGGCTGSSKMFAELDKNFEMLQSVSIPQWSGIHDWMAVYKKVSSDPIETDNKYAVVIVHGSKSMKALQSDLEKISHYFTWSTMIDQDISIVIRPKAIIARGIANTDDGPKAFYISNGEVKEKDIYPALLNFEPDLRDVSLFDVEDVIKYSPKFQDYLKAHGLTQQAR